MAVTNSSDLYEITSNFVVDQIVPHNKPENAGYRQFVALKAHLREKEQIDFQPIEVVEPLRDFYLSGIALLT